MKSKAKDVKNNNLVKFRELYESAFPIDERRDFADVESLMGDDASHFHVCYFEENNKFSGFLTYWEWDDMRYFEHFAVDPLLRGGGLGAGYLKKVVEMKTTPVILEVEPPVDEIAKRRVGFYQRNGFRLWNELYYLQPSYGEGRNPMKLKLMTFGEIDFTGEDDDKILRIKREVYGCKDF